MTADSRLPPYLPYPRFLLGADLTQTARLIYAVLLDRATLSQANGWTDEDGRLFIVFTISAIAEAIERSAMTVKNSLNELETAGLIERRRGGFSLPNRIYVKLPEGQKTVHMMDKKLSLSGIENCPSEGQKIVHMMDRKLSPNNLSINNLRNNNLSRTRETRARGRYENVLLTDREYQELSSEIGGLDSLIEELSVYMKSSGKTYADHAATLLRWSKHEKAERGIPEYACSEGESL